MKCVKCFKKAKLRGQNLKSRDPYIATAYYFCPHCHTSFSIDKTQGEVISPNDPDQTLKRVLQDLTTLPKPLLQLVSKNVTALM